MSSDSGFSPGFVISDERVFHVSGFVDIQNIHDQGSEIPREIGNINWTEKEYLFVLLWKLMVW